MMDLKEIVQRNDSKPLSQNECLFVIKEYVKIRKGANIEPFIDLFNIHHELRIMSYLAVKAINWLRYNYYN